MVEIDISKYQQWRMEGAVLMYVFRSIMMMMIK